MIDNEIKVRVIKYPGRRRLMMRYEDPLTGQQVARSTGTTKRRDAERAASAWEKELREGKYRKPTRITWEGFRERYESEKLSALSENTFQTCTSAFNHVEEIIAPKMLAMLTPPVLSRFQARLREQGAKETTIATHLRHLRAALSWAKVMGLLPAVPEIEMPKRAKGLTLTRGRPITAEEFERMLAATEKVRPEDFSQWKYYLEGLWLSGLRLEESLLLGWDEESPISVDFSGRRPRLRIYAEAEKGHQDRLLPLTPDFAQFLLRTPKAQRNGRIFELAGLVTDKPMTAKRVCRVISAIGKKAGVIVNKVAGKHASAHDLRRSFGTRWAARVKPATLQLMMRHKSIETTLKYYVAQDTDEIADQLWKEYGSDLESGAVAAPGVTSESSFPVRDLGNTLGNSQ